MMYLTDDGIPWKFSRILMFNNKDKDFQISPRGLLRTKNTNIILNYNKTKGDLLLSNHIKT